jgi:hypothetical protein
MTSTSLLQLVDNFQQAGKIRNLQQVCGVSGCVVLCIIFSSSIVIRWHSNNIKDKKAIVSILFIVHVEQLLAG